MTRTATYATGPKVIADDMARGKGTLSFCIGQDAFVAMDRLSWLSLGSDQDRRQLRERACGTLKVGGILYIVFSEREGPDSADLPPDVLLTRRELEIANEIARGAANKEIARLLGISHLTVREHVRRVCSKMGVHSRAAIAGRIGAQPMGGKGGG
jgi:DNA-binding CsgD family transcriptional regulator